MSGIESWEHEPLVYHLPSTQVLRSYRVRILKQAIKTPTSLHSLLNSFLFYITLTNITTCDPEQINFHSTGQVTNVKWTDIKSRHENKLKREQRNIKFDHVLLKSVINSYKKIVDLVLIPYQNINKVNNGLY